MAEDYTGNVLRVPGLEGKGPTTDDEILASYSGLTQKGLTLRAGGSGAAGTANVLRTGTVLTVSATAKKYRGATAAEIGTAATPGTAALVGILRKDVDATNVDKLANVVLAGRVKGSKVKNAAGGVVATADLPQLASRLGGRYSAHLDMLIF